MKIQDNLTDIEIVEIEKFCANEAMYEAVKKVIFMVINDMGVVKKGKKCEPLWNAALGLVARKDEVSNEQLGADLRGYYHGVSLLQSGFEALSKIKVEKIEIPKETNEAI